MRSLAEIQNQFFIGFGEQTQKFLIPKQTFWSLIETSGSVRNCRMNSFISKPIYSFLYRLGASESSGEKTMLRNDIYKSIYIDPRLKDK